MKHYIQEKDQCLLFSAAMVLDIDPDILAEEIGHDGQDIWWPEYSDARKYRGHTMQEIIDVALPLAHGFIPIQSMPMQCPTGAPPRLTFETYEHRFTTYISEQPAIIIGQLKGSEVGHAVAWDGYRILDPNDSIKILSDFSIKEAWLLVHL